MKTKQTISFLFKSFNTRIYFKKPYVFDYYWKDDFFVMDFPADSCEDEYHEIIMYPKSDIQEIRILKYI